MLAMGMALPGLTVTYFLVTKAPVIHHGLDHRARRACTILSLAAGDLLRDLRNQINSTLHTFDSGEDPYMMRVDFSLPTPLLRRYKQINKLERLARKSPVELQKCVMKSAWSVGAFSLAAIATGALAAAKDWVGLVPAQWALAAAGALLLAALTQGAWFLRPYRRVHRAELLASAESAQRPSVANAARTLGLEDRTVDPAQQENSW